jgi:hypothetical protein
MSSQALRHELQTSLTNMPTTRQAPHLPSAAGDGG